MDMNPTTTVGGMTGTPTAMDMPTTTKKGMEGMGMGNGCKISVRRLQSLPRVWRQSN
jgi:hypothetical protein